MAIRLAISMLLARLQKGFSAVKSIMPVLGTLLLLILAVARVEAQGAQPDIDPKKIEINIVKDNSEASATFYVISRAGMQKISFFASDLQDTTGVAQRQPVLLASQITFSPASLDDPRPNQRAQVQVKVGNINRAGSWAGKVIVQWAGAITGELTLPMTVTMKTVPTIVAESPIGVVVASVGGSRSGPRRVTLHETSLGSPVTNISVYPRDLINENQTRVLSSRQITASLDTHGAEKQIPSGGRGDLLVDLDLAGVQSGSYSGSIVVQSANADDLLIPMTVQVKDPPIGAILVLGIGVLLGVALTWYRSNVMPKDQLRVGIDEMRDYTQQHAEFRTYFYDKVESQLALVAERIRRNDVPTATTALEQVQNWRTAWEQNHIDLMTSVEMIRVLIETIATSEDGFKNLEAVKQFQAAASQLLEREIPNYVEKPAELRDKIENATTGWKKIIERLLKLYQDIQTLKSSLDSANRPNRLAIEADSLDELKQQLQTVDNELRSTDVPDVPKIKAWQTQVDTFHTTLDSISKKGAQDKITYETHHTQAGQLLDQVLRKLGSLTVPHIVEAIKTVRSQGLTAASKAADDFHWAAAARTAQNSWRAAQAASFLAESAIARQGQTTGAWQEVLSAEQKLAGQLKTSDYNQEAEAFFNSLKQSTPELQDALQKAGVALAPDWSEQSGGVEPPSLGGDDVPATVPGLSPERNIQAPAPSVSRRLQTWWQSQWQRVWTPQNRLRLLNVLTFFIGVGALILVGYKELYQDVATFGVEGVWDYFKLLIWGFGAEAGRAQVVGLVKDWGIITPRQA
jgi:hypothetical protein